MPRTAGRAAALPPEERRKALMLAAVPLMLAHGTDVSTREIAEAAGVAEGTIFRVFPTKDDLVEAVVASVLDPSVLVDAIHRVDRSAPLTERLVAAVELMQERGRQVAHFLHAIAARGPAAREHNLRGGLERLRVVDALAVLIEPDRGQLRCSPTEAARRLRLVTTALSSPRFVADDALPAREVVSLLLDGLRARAEAGAPRPTTTSIGVPSC
jgi:AcrR family transcriptional regulator